MIYSAIPVVVFVIVDATAGLPIAIGAAIAVAVLTAGQLWFYETHATGMLATAKIAMGFPLFAAFIGVAVWAFRGSTRRLVA
ncbi:hypothetical protein IA539_22100 [Gordonia sp. zg691]|uniref:Uncharacterized protein n=1 Tax=Gordonia jinghuaiqii TaxID=2758710 RepID=A0A7D7M045_9ACTN|nr:hypothetical protein [Gordonia jinghuaiqii]MBD0863867.1 hypothetical protein [Gordonia jinghuaiqii]MCR5979911.1 DUF3159 domain-containing protein [Gordonia jinghuaiqii]QMT03114.1 hypothetical protein H1R19_08380 [Gordonia jinghuaiqii]